jgi:uncharacterized membrane protein (DUF485 family)
MPAGTIFPDEFYRKPAGVPAAKRGVLMSGDSKTDRKLRYMVLMCVLVVLPYTLFMILLDTSPATLQSSVSGSVITVAIYFAIVLFLWPIAMAIVFINRSDKS